MRINAQQRFRSKISFMHIVKQPDLLNEFGFRFERGAQVEKSLKPVSFKSFCKTEYQCDPC